jgi:TonB-dependent SusC/RagA subfamily outer membrane receptor
MLLKSDNSLDSTTYMINGVPATRAEVNALNPDKIISLDLLDAKHAREFYQGNAELKSRVLFVTTNDSEAGKRIKEKINKSFRSGTLARTYNLSIDSPNYTPAAVGSGVSVSTNTYSVSSDDAPVVLSSSGSNNVSTSVMVVGQPKATMKLKKLDKVNFTKAPVSTYTISGDDDTTHHVYALNLKAMPAVKAKNMVYLTGMRPNDEATIDSPNPLIIIDGKEAKSLKNIASDDINSITILKDGSATKLYGDKGKNGVIVIKTKKGK